MLMSLPWAGRRASVCTLASDLSSLGLNINPAINCHPGVLHLWRCITKCAVSRMHVKLGVLSASTSLVFKIPRHLWYRLSVLFPPPWISNSCYLQSSILHMKENLGIWKEVGFGVNGDIKDHGFGWGLDLRL